MSDEKKKIPEREKLMKVKKNKFKKTQVGLRDYKED